MKKLGTPSGAGPGSAKLKVGFEALGTPGPVGPLGVAFSLAARRLEALPPGDFEEERDPR
jgi:hypothetical protein